VKTKKGINSAYRLLQTVEIKQQQQQQQQQQSPSTPFQ
jgi:hypothetical protein